MARHKAVKPGKPDRPKREPNIVKESMRRRRREHLHVPVIIGSVIAVLSIMFGTAWFIPAQYVPLSKTIRTCTVTGGGTLRVITSDCGTLLYRGRISLLQGETAYAVTTGQIAWQIEPAEEE
ncbi:hypothetical protein [Bifidobacterium sp. SO1]|uniref:hypothetical protein n=1 Tax=Bifidobacterium sp. SO1 TaxID=2809029 RepID=UPI001BDBFA2C|nr:hypothetical protein [Bifidobacterium sp. SO1]MBT1162221.1 hypothetical protein [Bifidobacterium sp. SO1]